MVPDLQAPPWAVRVGAVRGAPAVPSTPLETPPPVCAQDGQRSQKPLEQFIEKTAQQLWGI